MPTRSAIDLIQQRRPNVTGCHRLFDIRSLYRAGIQCGAEGQGNAACPERLTQPSSMKLVGLSRRLGAGAPNLICRLKPSFFGQVLGETLRAHTRGAVQAISRVDDVRLVGRNASGRATVEITADGREYTLRGDSIRWVLRPQPGPAILNSSLLHDVAVERGTDGVASLEVRGGGWGHAIGMCQVGAMGRAAAGHSYRDILAAYYQGATLSRLY